LFELLDPPVGLHSSWHIAIKIVSQHEQGVWAYAMIGTPSLHRGGNRSLLSGFSYGWGPTAFPQWRTPQEKARS
jgi:hypothetical protein